MVGPNRFSKGRRERNAHALEARVQAEGRARETWQSDGGGAGGGLMKKTQEQSRLLLPGVYTDGVGISGGN